MENLIFGIKSKLELTIKRVNEMKLFEKDKKLFELENTAKRIIEMIEIEQEKIDWTHIDNDTNGNPRYVCHFLAIDNDYSIAVKLANKIGGRKYHNKSYGGGIVFQSYNIENTEKAIKELLMEA